MTSTNGPSLIRIIRIIRTGLILTAFIASRQLYSEVTAEDPYDSKAINFCGLSQEVFKGDNNDIAIATEMFFKEISSHIGMKSKFTMMDDKSKIRDAMLNFKLHVVFSNSIDYLDLDPLMNPDFRYTLTFGPSPEPEQRLYLLIPKNSSISKIRQLKGKRLSITKGNTLSRTYLEVILAKAGLPAPEQFFSSIHHPISNNAAVLDVFFGKADLAIADNIAYSLAAELNPQIRKKIKVLAISDPYIPYVIGINKWVPPTLIDQVDNILLNLKQDPRLSRILSSFKATNVVKIRSEQLETLRVLKQEHEQLVGGNHN